LSIEQEEFIPMLIRFSDYAREFLINKVQLWMPLNIDLTEDPIQDMYSKLGEKFELSVVSDFVVSEILVEPDYSFISLNSLEICLPSGHEFTLNHVS